MSANKKYFFSEHEEKMGQILCCCGYLAEAIEDIEQTRFDAYTTYMSQILHANNKFLSPTPITNPSSERTPNIVYYKYVASLYQTLQNKENEYLSDMAFLTKPSRCVFKYIKRHHSAQDVLDMAFAVMIGKVADIHTRYMSAKFSIKNHTSSNKAIELLDSHMQNEISSAYNEFQTMVKKYCRQEPDLHVSPALFVVV